MAHARVVGCVLLGLVVVVGCGKEKEAPRPGPGPGPNPDGNAGAPQVPAQFAAARKVFDANCVKCHSTDPGGFAAGKGFPGGPPGKEPGKFPPGGFKGGMRKGPSLAKVGADPKHTREWLISYIRDPKSQKENARMPKFEGKLSEDDLTGLADYLGSLK